MASNADILKEVREIIGEEKNWCQGAFAKDKHGLSVFETSDEACTFCLLGAFWRVASKHKFRYAERQPIRQLLRKQLPKGWSGSLDSFNDSHTHKEVLAIVDAAIVEAEKEG